MASYLLFKESTDSIVAGFPKTVEITYSDETAIIYYNLSTETPTAFSSVYSDPIELPTNSEPFTITAIAYYNQDGYWLPSNVLSYTWTLDNSAFFNARDANKTGITYLYPGGLDIPYWYDFEGNPSTFVDVDPDELPIYWSEYDSHGRPQESGFHQSIIPDALSPQRDLRELSYYSMLGYQDFNPDAPLILIDSRIDSIHKPAVLVANSEYMSLRNPLKYNNGADLRNAFYGGTSFTSGQHVRSFYNEKTNTFVSYYYDNTCNHWIKDITTTHVTESTVAPTGFTKPLVFQWNLWGRRTMW